jgi:hypothetical protein
MVAICKECCGLGSVPFTKERGGPCCNNCGGYGYLHPKIALHVIGTILDNPSVYMGGPSQQSLRRAKMIVDYLIDEGVFK